MTREVSTTSNPFVGARPCGAADRERFFGRDELSGRLAESVLGTRCVTLYGPPGAGKTSLLRASVLPALAAAQDVREVYIHSWPPGEDPILRLAAAMSEALLSSPVDQDLSPSDAVMSAAKRAARASSRLMILCLDQIEQLIYFDRPAAPTEAFLVCLEALLELPLRPVRVILSLREDYLGRFLDMLRGRLRMMEQYYRVVPFTVAELTDIVCKLAATGVPPQQWSPDELTPLMMEMRVHDQPPGLRSEVRLSYAQGFCQALFARRATGGSAEPSVVRRDLANYIERTVVDIQLPYPGLLGADESETDR